MKLTHNELFEALGLAMEKIEAAGASPELTDAVILVGDIRASIGNTWNPSQDERARLVRLRLKSDATRQRNIFNDVANERKRQDEKWGEQNHDLFDWMTILMEEVGETAKAALQSRYGGSAAENLRAEAIQATAVLTAMIECIDRGTWKWDTKNS